MKNKYITALVLVCMVTFTGCPNPYPAPHSYVSTTTAPSVTESPEIPTFTSGEYSITMPPISFLAMMYSEEDDYLAFNDALYITNYMQSWYYNTSDRYESALRHIIQEEDDDNLIFISYEDELKDSALSFEEYQLMTGFNCPDIDEDCDGIHFRLKYNGIGKPPHDSKVLEYACELVRRERLVPKNKYVCVDIGYSVRDDIIYADVYIIDGMGKRCIVKEGIVGGNADITYDRAAHSLYFMPHIPEYRKDDIRPMNEPDPADFDVILPYIYTSSDSKRYDLKKLAEEMPDIHTMYIPKYAELDISSLSLFPLDTLYIYVGGMNEEELTALSRLHLDKLVMYGADSKLDMFTECDINHIGVYMDKPCRDVTGSTLYIPSLDEAGIIAEKEFETHNFKTDKIKKLSILSQDSADLSFLSGCTALEELEISGIWGYDGLDAIASLPIKSLSVNCPGQDISFISDMTSLEHLTMRNGFADMSALPLESLNVICRDAGISSFPPTLKELRIETAERIDLSSVNTESLDSLTIVCRSTAKTDLSPLASACLSQLTIDAEADLSQLTGAQVKSLTVKGNAYNAAGLADISGLERAYVESASASDMDKLKEALPGCELTWGILYGSQAPAYTPHEVYTLPETVNTSSEPDVHYHPIKRDDFKLTIETKTYDDSEDIYYEFLNSSDEDMDHFPDMLEEEGLLDGYTCIYIEYPNGLTEYIEIKDGHLLPDTSELYLPALYKEKLSEEEQSSTVLHPGESAEGSLFV